MTTYKNVIRGQGYTILNQSQFYAKNDGIVVYGAQEGERVPVDYEIATVNFQDDFSSQKDDLIRIQAAIDYKSNKRSSEKDNYQETPEIRKTIEKIQSSIKDNDFQAMISDINNLDLITPHNVNISELSELLNEPLELLEEKRKTYQGPCPKPGQGMCPLSPE
ncbi:conserved domain protein [Peptoniphilus sp. oral taxon 375 str. F0436]|nr:conserved domain protein [Peptoniphilus sp. oral taxon 375 str. F0436]